MTKGVYEKINEGVLRWLNHVERMENYRFAKRFHVGECAGSRSVGRPRKRWIDNVKGCLRKEVWVSAKQGELCRIGVNGEGL